MSVDAKAEDENIQNKSFKLSNKEIDVKFEKT